MLPDPQFQVVYTSGDAEPSEFFFDALCNSISFDLALGYFHSSGFQALAFGFAKFIIVGGSMRMIINDHLELEDKEAIERGLVADPHELIEDRIIKNFDNLFRVLRERDIHFFNCLSWLIASKKLEMRAIVPKHSNQGIAHQKYGVFRDRVGNRLAFNGSANFSYGAMKNNLETITCFKSWTDEQSDLARVSYYESTFEKMWQGNHQGATTIPLEKVKTHIQQRFGVRDKDELHSSENELMHREQKQARYPASTGTETGRSPEDQRVVPRFPFPDGPREYQKEACRAWVSRNHKGIFAMATGTGKTITSLNCALEEYKKSSCYHLLILVPTLTLVEQWKKEVASFCFENVFEISGEADWRPELTQLKNRLKAAVRSNFVIVSTYQSFIEPLAQKLIKEIDQCTNGNLILIADEAHNIGSTGVKTAFAGLTVSKRIALSATPKREYDPEGSSAIETYFDDKPPYCYSFSLARAIREKFLSQYYYFPTIVKLAGDELQEYVRISQQLLKFYDKKSGTFRRDENVTRLLIKRKRVIHKAEQKTDRLVSICREIGAEKLKYCFVYAPEGEDDESEENILQRMREALAGAMPGVTQNTITSKVPLRERGEILRGFSEGRIDVLFAMKILDEGVDIPRAEIGIFASSAANPRQFIQRRGRLLRRHPDKRFARIHDMIVVPDYTAPDYDPENRSVARSLIRSELTRVAYFASISLNFADSRDSLQEVMGYYNLSLDSIIDELSDE